MAVWLHRTWDASEQSTLGTIGRAGVDATECTFGLVIGVSVVTRATVVGAAVRELVPLRAVLLGATVVVVVAVVVWVLVVVVVGATVVVVVTMVVWSHCTWDAGTHSLYSLSSGSGCG